MESSPVRLVLNETAEKDQLELNAGAVPTAEGIYLQGRHLQSCSARKGRFVIVNQPTLAFDPRAIG